MWYWIAEGFGFTLGAVAALVLCFVLANFCKGFAQAFGKSYRAAAGKKRAEKERQRTAAALAELEHTSVTAAEELLSQLREYQRQMSPTKDPHAGDPRGH